jgi:hypothetical protein
LTNKSICGIFYKSKQIPGGKMTTDREQKISELVIEILIAKEYLGQLSAQMDSVKATLTSKSGDLDILIRELMNLTVAPAISCGSSGNREATFLFDRSIFPDRTRQFWVPNNAQKVRDEVAKKIKSLPGVKMVHIRPDGRGFVYKFNIPQTKDKSTYADELQKAAAGCLTAILTEAGYLEPSFKYNFEIPDETDD